MDELPELATSPPVPMTNQLTWFVESLHGDYDVEVERSVVNIAEADTISSEMVEPEGHHRVILDIDVPAKLIPSSTPGHHHLYIESKPVPWETYRRLLDALTECGVIEQGYRDAAVSRKGTHVRLPWRKKEKKHDDE